MEQAGSIRKGSWNRPVGGRDGSEAALGKGLSVAAIQPQRGPQGSPAAGRPFRISLHWDRGSRPSSLPPVLGCRRLRRGAWAGVIVGKATFELRQFQRAETTASTAHPWESVLSRSLGSTTQCPPRRTRTQPGSQGVESTHLPDLLCQDRSPI